MEYPAHSSILVMAGEPSGDWAASRVVSEIRKRTSCRFYGVGGDEMANAGVSLLGHINRLTALGFKEISSRLFGWLDVWYRIRRRTRKNPPKVAVLVDSPEVNLPLARILTALGVRVVFYVGPQVWAWRPDRLHLLRERVDVTALVLPFEKPLYDAAGARSVFVGHPILDRTVKGSYASVRMELSVGDEEKLISFLPGSRRGEVEYLAEPMIETMRRIAERGYRSVVVPANTDRYRQVAGAFREAGALVVPPDFGARRALRGSDGAVICSGTATLEATVETVPHVVLYRMDGLSHAVARRVVRSPFIGLSNLVVGRSVVTELVQSDVCPDRIGEEVSRLFDPQTRTRMIRGLVDGKKRLGKSGAAYKVANLVLERLL